MATAGWVYCHKSVTTAMKIMAMIPGELIISGC